MGTAVISPCGTYRYKLERPLTGVGICCFVMLNPSTADGEKDDPTLRRCIGFAKREGMGSLEVVNLFAFRATNPELLHTAGDPVGPENDQYLRAAFDRANLIICAWGEHGSLHSRDRQVMQMIGGRAMCLGLTAKHQPKHPLYIPKEAPLIPFKVREGVP